jgi:hypothetical protein
LTALPLAFFVEELDLKLQQSRDAVMSIQDSLNTSIFDLSVQPQTMTTRMEKQNTIILGMENSFKETDTDFSIKLKEIYELVQQTSTYTPTVSTNKSLHWGRSVK